MSPPLVSVLLPIHNAAGTLPSALRSLRRQSLERFEVLAVDDGSTDGSSEILDAFAQNDDRIRPLHTPHRGLCAALNRGLEGCRTPLVARMDADDLCARRRLELQQRFLHERPEVGVAGCQVKMAPRREVTDGMERYQQWLNQLLTPAQIRRELWVESPLCHPSAMIRADLLRGVGGYRDRGWPEDYDLWLRLDRAGVAMAKVDRPLLTWRESEHRLTRQSPAYAREQFLRLKLHHLRRRLRGRKVLVWGAGMEGKPWLKALRQEDLLEGRVVDVDPRKVGQKIHGCKVIRPEDLPPPGPEFLVLAAVGAPGARDQIREFLDSRGYIEQENYLCVA